jgi:hypothetical protein
MNEKPVRVQLSRKKGYRKPENTVVVARPSLWGNPFRVGVAQLRFPRVDDGAELWEFEGRLGKRSGSREAFHHGDFSIRPDGSKEYRVTWHEVRDATVEECVELFRQYVCGGGPMLDWTPSDVTADIREKLAGHNLACWCPLDQPCHADVLLEIANGEHHD